MAETKQCRGATRWYAVAVVYFVIAVVLGMAMAGSHNYTLKGVHVHLNLLGWVSMSLIGLLYERFPAAAQKKSACIQFWLHNIGLPLMMVALAAWLLGNQAIEPLLAIGATLVLIAVLIFAFNILQAVCHDCKRQN